MIIYSAFQFLIVALSRGYVMIITNLPKDEKFKQNIITYVISGLFIVESGTLFMMGFYFLGDMIIPDVNKHEANRIEDYRETLKSS
jgi:hypothetical protein